MANYLVLDTETANDLECPFCYDCGWSIINEKGVTLMARSFVVADIFLDEPNLMREAYFADKIPQYWVDIKSGKRVLRTFKNVRKQLHIDCKDFEIAAIIAHNMPFDYRSCSTTQRYLTCSKYRYFFPYGVPLWDSLKMAKQTFAKNADYVAYCVKNGYVTSKGLPRLTAEILYRYIVGDPTFEESHTGLEDTQIEKEIFLACLALDPTIDCACWG